MKNLFKVFGIIAIATIACANGNGDGDENLIFYDDFNGTSLDTSKWNICYDADRQGGSSWRDDMVSVSGGYLHLKFKRDAALGAQKSSDPTIANNWIRAGGIRTRKRDWSSILFENSYGYYEAKIKFPVVAGTWGAFWLMSPTQTYPTNNGKNGTEIDIVESINNYQGKYNAALHWDGYGEQHKSISSTLTKVNIYNGEFHVFALEWTPTAYIFYVDNVEFWRVTGGAEFNNLVISDKKNYIKLTVEAAPWAGTLPEGFTEDEMLVDYVKVFKQKPWFYNS
jgi:beta-glucanase (GH16 family)